MHDKNILIMAGGTGGHVYPALAVADKLKEKGFELFWLGTSKGLESTVVPEQGYPLLEIKVTGVRGKGIKRILVTPFMLIIALCQALIIMVKLRPVVVLGMGGFASGPGGIAAWLMRIPLLIHEQNAIAGLTNRLLAPFAVSVLAAFPGAFKASDKITVTGNPVRGDILDLPDTEERFQNRDQTKLRVLVLGGSLGAKRINEVVPQTLALMKADCKFEVIHQCGKQHLASTEKEYKKVNIDAEVKPFIKSMSEVYGWADIVICRAGALTVSELAVSGVGSILIPFPYAVDDHQTANARFLSNEEAAILIQETHLNVEVLKDALLKLYHAPESLLQMAMKARALSKPEATETVANLCAEAAYA